LKFEEERCEESVDLGVGGANETPTRDTASGQLEMRERPLNLRN